MKIKTGLAAFGLSGQIFHAPFIEAHPDFELTAVAERSKKSAQATYPDVESVDSFEELLRCDVETCICSTSSDACCCATNRRTGTTHRRTGAT